MALRPQSDSVGPNQITLIVFLKFGGRVGVTKTKNIRKFVKEIKPGTAKYGGPYLHWNEEKKRGGGKKYSSGHNTKTD